MIQDTSTQMKKSPFKFIALVYVLSIPFWVIGALTEPDGIGSQGEHSG